IDAGDPLGDTLLPPTPTLDQRGYVRTSGTIDLGSVEVGTASTPVVTGFVVNNGAATRSRLTKITVTFASAVNAAQFQTSGAITLTRTVPAAGPVVNTSNGLIVAQAGANSLNLTFSDIVSPGSIENASLA